MRFRANKVRALAALGQIQEIRAVIDESFALSVGYWTPADVMCAAATELRVQGRFDTAREFAAQAVVWCHQQSNPQEYRWLLAQALCLAERWAEAHAVYSELAAEKPDNIEYLGKLGTLAVRMGDESTAREIYDNLRSIDRPYLKGEHTYWCACISALLGEREEAVALLEEAWNQLLVNPDIQWRDMDLEPLRDYPPFQEMIRPKG
jgi:tetratricopeptide (TPR) repeat protein